MDIVTLKYGNTRTFLLRGASGNLLIDNTFEGRWNIASDRKVTA